MNGQEPPHLIAGKRYGSVRAAKADLERIGAEQVRRRYYLSSDRRLSQRAKEVGVTVSELSQLLRENMERADEIACGLQDFVNSPEGLALEENEKNRASKISFVELTDAEFCDPNEEIYLSPKGGNL